MIICTSAGGTMNDGLLNVFGGVGPYGTNEGGGVSFVWGVVDGIVDDSSLETIGTAGTGNWGGDWIWPFGP